MYLVALREPLIEFGEQTFIHEDLLEHLQRLRDTMECALGSVTILAPLSTNVDALGSDSLVPFVAHQHGLRLLIASRWKSDEPNESPVAKAEYEDTLSNLLRATEMLQLDWQDLPCWGASPVILELLKSSGARLLIVESRTRTNSVGYNKSERFGRRSRIEIKRERSIQRILACADLCLFESQDLLRRFGPFCRNARLVRSSGFSRDQVISLSSLEERNRSFRDTDPIRLAFVDALTQASGIHHAVAIVRRAVTLGANLTLQICSDGPERQVVRYQLAKTRSDDRIVLKPLPPSSAAVRETLETSHGLLRTPLEEADDRSALMGFTAGLPIISYDESIALSHAAETQSVVLMPHLCIDTAARILLEVDQNRDWLSQKSILAREAGLAYSLENAYQRQAEHVVRLSESKHSFQDMRIRVLASDRMSRDLAVTVKES